MTLADPSMGGELVLGTGRVIPFDDAGCLASFVNSGAIPAGQVRSLWVSDFLPPHALLPVSDAVFLRSDALHTPMDYHLVALRRAAADSVRSALGGELLSWEQVLQTVRGHAEGSS
jgi:hypothetical protein